MSFEITQSLTPSLAVDNSLQPVTPNGNLASKAKEFESILLNQWLQGAETSFGAVPGEDDEDAGSQQMKSFSVQQLAKAFSDAGGIGIAETVSKALQPNASADHRTSPQPIPASPDRI